MMLLLWEHSQIQPHTFILIHTHKYISIYISIYLYFLFSFESPVLKPSLQEPSEKYPPPPPRFSFSLSLCSIQANFIFCLSSACASTTPDKKKRFSQILLVLTSSKSFHLPPTRSACHVLTPNYSTGLHTQSQHFLPNFPGSKINCGLQACLACCSELSQLPAGRAGPGEALSSPPRPARSHAHLQAHTQLWCPQPGDGLAEQVAQSSAQPGCESSSEAQGAPQHQTHRGGAGESPGGKHSIPV